jgi:hypothetical protein
VKSVLPVALLLGSAMLLASGCSKTTNVEVSYELTGETPTAAEVTRASPTWVDDIGGKIKTVTTTEKNVKVPYKQLIVATSGKVVLEAVPTKGALTCRIVVEGEEVAKVRGKADEKVKCEAKID